jgi:hypothetical protein
MEKTGPPFSSLPRRHLTASMPNLSLLAETFRKTEKTKAF